MNKLLLAILAVAFLVSCKKSDSAQQSSRAILTGHKWYYHTFRQDGVLIPLTYCDTNSYLQFYDGNKGGIGNDVAACYGTQGILSTFSYTYIPDSNIIHLKNFSGGDYTWTIVTLSDNTLQVTFTAPTPPPAYAPNFDYTYTTR